MLKVSVYPSLDTDEPLELDDVDYVSLVSGGTYGPPALVAPDRSGGARAAIGEVVLYLNTLHVPMFEIVRTSD